VAKVVATLPQTATVPLVVLVVEVPDLVVQEQVAQEILLQLLHHKETTAEQALREAVEVSITAEAEVLTLLA
jgi:hypothetical protein